MLSKTLLQDIVEWDVRNWAVALDYWRTHSRQNLRGSSALEIGSRNGGLSLWMALEGARVVCSDILGPTETAIRKHTGNGVSSRIEYECIDATDIPYVERFDIVLFKSVLGGIGSSDKGAQAKAIREIHKALKKGGELFFAENLTGSPVHRFFRHKCVTWGKTWRYISIDDMQEFLIPFEKVTYGTFGFVGAFGRDDRQRNALGYIDKVLLNRLLPSNWKYIIAGVARK